ncbi:MAG: metal-dependent transcriptional regulator [Gammaproteobacteria bacterium]
MTSITVENYLKHIYEEQQLLGAETDLVSVGRVAAAMGVTAGTATAMVKSLAKSRLIRHEPRRGVRLTDSGARIALQVVRRHRLIEAFLVKALGLDWSEVHAEAEELEHAISDKVLERIDAFLGHPAADPHGDPIPPPTGKLPRQKAMRLTDCRTDVPLRITRVLNQDPDFLRYVASHGLTPGESVTVALREPAADAVTVRARDREPVTLGTAAAAAILVESVGAEPADLDNSHRA